MTRLLPGLLLLSLAALPAPPARADPGDGRADGDPYAKVLEEFRKRMKRRDVESTTEAVELLDPDEPRSLPELLAVLAKGHWMVRGAAMEKLALVKAGPLRSEMRLNLVTNDDLWIREGIAFAMAIEPRPGDGDAMVGAMDDREWRVRRTAARGLGEIVSRDGARRLVEALEKETDLRVRVWVRASLRAIAGKDFGQDSARWREWFERHKDRPEWVRQGEEVRRAEFAGIPLETVTIGGPPPGSDTGKKKKRPDLFVLAPFGYSHGYFRPYLDEASRFVRITYVTLPSVKEITGHTGYGGSIPTYPVGKLSRALNALRKQLGKERVVVLAHGPAGWIAEKYALEYDKHVAGLVIVNGWLDSKSYAVGLMRLAGKGSPAERWAANTLMNRLPANRDVREGQRIRRILITHGLADRRDSEAYRLWKDESREHGFVSVPDLKFTRHLKIHTPTLFYFPGDSPLAGVSEEDKRRIRASFKKPPPVIAEMRDSRGMAHIEEPEKFLDVLEKFFRFAGVIE